jgi:hypothetical protein
MTFFILCIKNFVVCFLFFSSRHTGQFVLDTAGILGTHPLFVEIAIGSGELSVDATLSCIAETLFRGYKGSIPAISIAPYGTGELWFVILTLDGDWCVDMVFSGDILVVVTHFIYYIFKTKQKKNELKVLCIYPLINKSWIHYQLNY